MTAPFPRDEIPPPIPPIQAGVRRNNRPGTERADFNLFVLLQQRLWEKKKKKTMQARELLNTLVVHQRVLDVSDPAER